MIDMTKLNASNPWAEMWNTSAKDMGGGFEASPGAGDLGRASGGTNWAGGSPTFDESAPYSYGSELQSQPGWSSWNPDASWLSQYTKSGGTAPTNQTTGRWAQGGDPAAKNIQQNWWSSPDWAGINEGDSAVYNAYYGFQPYSQVANQYRSAGGPVSNEAFTGWGWTPNTSFNPLTSSSDGGGLDPDLDKIYPKIDPIVSSSGGNPTYQYPNDYSFLSDYSTGTAMPWQWDQAGDVLSQFAYGQNATPDPEAWTQTQSDLSQLIGAKGMPTSYAPAYQQAKAVAQTDIEDAIKQAAEQAGLGGMRWSTPLGRSAQDIAGRTMAKVGTDWTTQELGAQEAGMGRAMQALQQMQNLGSSQAQLWEAPKERAMQAASGLTNLGSVYGQYPLDVAKQGWDMGQGLQAQDTSGLSKAYQDFLRMSPESNPYLSGAMSFATASGQPQQYQQGTGTSILSLLGTALGAGGGCLG